MGGIHGGYPVSQRFVDGVFESPCTNGHGFNLGTKHFHPGHIERLSLGIGFTHIHGTFHAKKRRCGCGGHTVLTCPSLSDETSFAHALSQQCLADDVVDLMRSCVVQIFALQENANTWVILRETGNFGKQ